jgi:hypothetical protein
MPRGKAAPFHAIYTETQREACAIAHVDRMLTARKVAEMAAADELTFLGETLEPFEIKPATISDLGRKLRHRRNGKVSSEVARMKPGDAVEALRRRLLAVADAELGVIERQARGKRDLDRYRDIVKCVREAMSIPAANDERPTPAGKGRHDQQGTPRPPATAGRLAGPLMAAHRQAPRSSGTDVAGAPENGNGPAEAGPSGDSGDAG